MYSSALEWLLYNQGYTSGMLGSKIQKLEDDVKTNNNLAPKWIFEIPSDFLNAIKEIGKGAIHTNGGDISKQKQIDANLLQLIDNIFAELLDKIYEQPIRSQNNLVMLQSISFKP